VTRIDLAEFQIVGLRADNPGPFTLTGTNSWIFGERPGWLVDPGPDLPEHVEWARGGARLTPFADRHSSS